MNDSRFEPSVERIQSQVFTLQIGETNPYIWRESKPNLLYHPDAWLQSLDDTPADLFPKRQKKDMDVRKSIKGYLNLKGADKLQPPKWDLNNVSHEIKPIHLLFLSSFDIVQDKDKFVVQKIGRTDQSQITKFFDPKGDDENSDQDSDSEDENDTTKSWDKQFSSHSKVWSTLLSQDTIDASKFPDAPDDRRKSLLDLTQRKTFSIKYQKRLFDRLNDSVCFSLN